MKRHLLSSLDKNLSFFFDHTCYEKKKCTRKCSSRLCTICVWETVVKNFLYEPGGSLNFIQRFTLIGFFFYKSLAQTLHFWKYCFCERLLPLPPHTHIQCARGHLKFRWFWDPEQNCQNIEGFACSHAQGPVANPKPASGGRGRTNKSCWRLKFNCVIRSVSRKISFYFPNFFFCDADRTLPKLLSRL